MTLLEQEFVTQANAANAGQGCFEFPEHVAEGREKKRLRASVRDKEKS
jgi:hypothetical protein